MVCRRIRQKQSAQPVTPTTVSMATVAQNKATELPVTPTPAEITQLWGMVSHDNYESFVIAHARAVLRNALRATLSACTTCPPSCAGGPREAQELHGIEPLVRIE